MANTWNTTDLINKILLKSHAPTGNNTFDNTKILSLADDELQTPILAQILSTRGGYYLDYIDNQPASDGLYPIPSAAVAGALANIEIVNGTSITPVNPIEESEQFSTVSPTATSYGCFVRGNYVQVLPTTISGVLRMWFFRRPSNLIQTTQACQVTAINGAVISVASIPSTITSGSLVDAIGDQPPFNVYSSTSISNITGTNITLSAPVTGLNVGDWLALSGQTPIPPIPVEFRTLLVQRVVCKIYELQGYLNKLQAAQASLKELEEVTFGLISPRVKSQTKIVNPVNGGFLGKTSRRVNFPAGSNF